MSDKIDVLAALDDLHESAIYYAQCIGQGQDADLLALLTLAEQARDAVAELIEAGQKYDAAMRSEADTDGMLRREDARARLRAALSRMTP
jgi:hypothetical protein